MPGIGSIFGPMLIGVYFNAILYGVLVMQIYLYFQHCNQDAPRDARWIQYLVVFLLIAETVNSVLDFDIVWESLIQKFGQAPRNTPLMLSTNPFVTAVISTSVQLFQGWRIRKFTKSNVIFIAIGISAWGALAAGLASTILIAQSPEFASLPHFKGSLLSWLVASALGDIIISISLVWFLFKNQGDFASTNSVLNKIILLTIQTGMITSVAALADVITFMLVSDTTLEFIWDFSLSKLYTNSLLSMLNARVEWNSMIASRHAQSNISFIHIEGLSDYAKQPVKPAISSSPAHFHKQSITKPLPIIPHNE